MSEQTLPTLEALESAHGGLVRRIVGSVRRPAGVEPGDLESAAWIEVARAWPGGYDPVRGSIPAWITVWARAGARRWLAEHRRTVRLPVWLVTRTAAIARHDARTLARHGRPASDPELAEAGLERPEWAPTMAEPESWNAPVTDAATVGDGVSDAAPGAEHDFAAAELTRLLHGALADLPARERSVLVLRFGLDGAEPCSFEQIGAKLGRSHETVRQIAGRALARLRHSRLLAEVGEPA